MFADQYDTENLAGMAKCASPPENLFIWLIVSANTANACLYVSPLLHVQVLSRQVPNTRPEGELLSKSQQ